MIAKFHISPMESDKILYTSEKFKDLKIGIKVTSFKKCERCWQRRPEVGTLENPELCLRCFEVIKKG